MERGGRSEWIELSSRSARLRLTLSIMFLIYSILLTLAFVVLLPRFLFDTLRNGKYADGFRQRLGHLPNSR